MIGFNGGLIGANRVYTTNSPNSGVWTLDEHMYPRRGYRYIRWTIVTNRSNPGQTQAADFNLRFNTTNISMASSTVTSSPSAGSAPNDVSTLKDNNVNTKWFFLNALPVSAIFDMGAPVIFNGYRWFTANDESGRDPVSWTVSGSNDGTNYNTLHTVTSHATTTTRLAEVGPFSF
jgi:hypothetical protein